MNTLGVESGSKHTLCFISVSVCTQSLKGSDWCLTILHGVCVYHLNTPKVPPWNRLEFFHVFRAGMFTCDVLLLKVQMTTIKFRLHSVLIGCSWIARFLLFWILLWKQFELQTNSSRIQSCLKVIGIPWGSYEGLVNKKRQQASLFATRASTGLVLELWGQNERRVWRRNKRQTPSDSLWMDTTKVTLGIWF